jgi:FkbM family methyltransferase
MNSFFRQLFSEGALVFDIGAYLGDMTELFLSSGAGRVVAIEPQYDIFHKLRERFETSKVFDKSRVTALNFAIGKETRSDSMYICRGAQTLSTFSEKWTTGRFKNYKFEKSTIAIPMFPLDFLIEVYGIPEYIKIDVEGYEIEVLSGLSTPVNSLSFEFTKEFLADVSQCAHLINKLGLYEYNYIRGDNTVFETDWSNFPMVYEHIYQNLMHVEEAWGNVYARLRSRS